MRRANLSRFALFKTTEKYHSIFIEMNCFILKLENPRCAIVAFLSFFQYISERKHEMSKSGFTYTL